MAACRWTEGFWKERFELCHRTMLPAMREAILDESNSTLLTNFRVGAGVEQGPHRGTNWSDGDCYKWLEALAHVYVQTGDPQLDREMDYWIDLIARTQAPDGYINTQVQLDPRKSRWDRRLNHELYNMGHLITAACVHHAATGKRSLLDVAIKAADYLYGVFAPRPKELAHFGFNPSQIMALVELYRTTQDSRYLTLAQVFVDMRGSEPWPQPYSGLTWRNDPTPGDQTQDRVPLREETEAVGHAVTGAYLYAGAADVAAETGEKALLDALDRLWRSVSRTKLFITGGTGALRAGATARLDRVMEAYGHPYELPSARSYNETCANIAHAMWSRRMLALSARAEYADEMERVLYNSGLSTMDLDGMRFCYCNPLARLEPQYPLGSHDHPERWKTAECYCCPPQVARTLGSLHEWAFGWSEGTLWMHLHGASHLDANIPGVGWVALTVRSNYPWDGHVEIRLEHVPAPAVAFAVRIRVPAWAEGATLSVNGQAASAVPAGEHAEVRQCWKGGDVIALELPMRVRMIISHPNVEETHNHVAMMRGPLVYCLEAVDLPDGVPIHEVVLPRSAAWSVRHDPSLLGGVTVLETQACRFRGPDWTDRLYAELPSSPSSSCERIALRLIPYYAWLNRGNGPMRVWLPLGW